MSCPNCGDGDMDEVSVRSYMIGKIIETDSSEGAYMVPKWFQYARVRLGDSKMEELRETARRAVIRFAGKLAEAVI